MKKYDEKDYMSRRERERERENARRESGNLSLSPHPSPTLVLSSLAIFKQSNSHITDGCAFRKLIYWDINMP